MRPEIRASLLAYALDGRETGGFLRACLENDLMEAVCRADENNLADIADIARFIYNELPAPCHGSPGHVQRWLAREPEGRRKLTLASLSDQERARIEEESTHA